MINLSINKYCHNCPDFEPEVLKKSIHIFDDTLEQTETTIFCANRNRCYEIQRYLERKEEGK